MKPFTHITAFTVFAALLTTTGLLHGQTNNGVGINTSDPLDDLHIMGSTKRGGLTITPDEPFSGDDSQIILAEDDDNTYNMSITFDGGDNRLYITGKNNAATNGPHMSINRDDGRVGIGNGTTNPVSLLEVRGTVTADDFSGNGAQVTNIGLESVSVYDVASGQTTGLVEFLRQDPAGNASTNRMLIYNPTLGGFQTKSYARVAFHASSSTDITVGDTAYAFMLLNNASSGENFEDCGEFTNCYYMVDDASTSPTPGNILGTSTGGYFQAPVDGVYFFEASALWDNTMSAEARNAIFIRVNNTDEVGSWSVSGGTDFFGTQVSTTLELNKGDNVTARIYNGDSSSMDTFSQSGKYNYFSGFLVHPQH